MAQGPAICNLIVLRSRDLERAALFYRALGLELQKHAHRNGPVHLASKLPEQVFEIYPLTEEALPTSSTRIGFAVSSVDEAYSALLEVGGESASAPKDSPWGRRAVVVDPDGHKVELTART